MKKIMIIGGGAAGMFAAIKAAQPGCEVHLYEKNQRLGKKLYITGKGRCNLTNDCDMEELFEGICRNPRFLYSAFYGYTNQDIIRFFEEQGMHTKTERGGRVFPISDKSSDVIDALRRAMDRSGVHIHFNSEVKAIQLEDITEPDKSTVSEKDKVINRKHVTGLELKDHTFLSADAVIVATGGLSYPSTGSTGDGYRFAKEAGLAVEECFPSLVPFNVKEEWVKDLQGLSLKNVTLGVYDGSKKLFEDFGEMMFTHFGVTGPLVLTASTVVQSLLRKKELQLVLDLKPALSQETLDARILREFESGKNKQFKNVIGNLYPSKLTPVMVALSGISPEKQINAITREERNNLVHLTKHLQLTATGLRDYNEAIVTRGGVSVKEIDPSTMESKKVAGLYFAGEVLDLDAVTGGFNLQIAWSTGAAAGLAAGKRS